MRTSVRVPRALCRAGCLVLVAGGLALLPLGAQPPGHHEPKKGGEVPRLQALAEQAVIPQAVLEQARNEVELLEAQLEVHKAATAEAATRLKVAEQQLALAESSARTAAVSLSAVGQAQGQVMIIQAQLKVKQAEQQVAEVRLRQAKQRLGRPQGEKPKGKDAPKPGGVKSLADLAKERLAVLDEMDRLRKAVLKTGQIPSASVELEGEYAWSRRRMEAEGEVSGKKAGDVAAAEAHLNRMKDLEELAKGRAAGAQGSALDALAARFYRLEAESRLLEARGAKGHEHVPAPGR